MNDTDKDRRSLLAIDFGERRIGIATGSCITGTSSALVTLEANGGEPDWMEFDALMQEWSPDVLVLGLPRNRDGSDSDITARTRIFAELLGGRYGCSVETIDERLTSQEASDILVRQRREGVRQKKLKRGEIDKMAAKLIADRWLQHNATNKNLKKSE
ncbi:MAG: Holliday junction resolvase RuvX [Gammaproteobacteria bacterium]